jgi:hypothetical protein
LDFITIDAVDRKEQTTLTNSRVLGNYSNSGVGGTTHTRFYVCEDYSKMYLRFKGFLTLS